MMRYASLLTISLLLLVSSARAGMSLITYSFTFLSLCFIEEECTGENEVYSSCGSFCTPTCQKPKEKLVICPLGCIQGCVCNEGFIRNEATGRCILQKDCP